MKKQPVSIAPIISPAKGAVQWCAFPTLERILKSNRHICKLGGAVQRSLKTQKVKNIEPNVINFLNGIFEFSERSKSDIKELREDLYWFSYSFVINEHDDVWLISSMTRDVFVKIIQGFSFRNLLSITCAIQEKKPWLQCQGVCHP